jgi:hypothetical protein
MIFFQIINKFSSAQNIERAAFDKRAQKGTI